jgi:hypothetical protein
MATAIEPRLSIESRFQADFIFCQPIFMRFTTKPF